MSSVNQNVIKHKVGLLSLAAELGNVSRAYKVMGFSQARWFLSLLGYHGRRWCCEALLDANRKKPSFRSRIEESIESAVVAFALEQPAFGQVRFSNELRKRGVFVSASGVLSVWLRHDLESFKKRFASLEKHVAAAGEVLTETQIIKDEPKPGNVRGCSQKKT